MGQPCRILHTLPRRNELLPIDPTISVRVTTKPPRALDPSADRSRFRWQEHVDFTGMGLSQHFSNARPRPCCIHWNGLASSGSIMPPSL